MLSQILRLATGFIDLVNDAAIGSSGGVGRSRFTEQLGMSVELTPSMLRVKGTPTVSAGTFQYVRLAPASDVPEAGTGVYWDATAPRSAFQVTTVVGTGAGVVLSENVTPGNYTVIQTRIAVPT